MPVEFKTHRLYAVKDAFIIEDAFTSYAAFAGILDTSYDALYTATGYTLTGTTHPWIKTGLPASLLVRYHKTAFTQGVVIGSDDHQYQIKTDSSGYPSITFNDAVVQSIPIATPQEADVTVGFRQIQMSDDETDLWVTLSLWMNDKFITSYTVRGNALIQQVKFGFTAGSYTTISIPELTDYTEYGTLDPGEPAYGGLNRAIEGRYLKFFLRLTGALRAWKVKPVLPKITLAFKQDYDFTQNYDLRSLMTRVRMMGAYIWAEAFNAANIMAYGDRFQEVNNPMLLTAEECAVEAEKTLIRAEEEAFTGTLDIPFLPLLEPEDRINTADGDFLISQQAFNVAPGAIDHNLSVRKYLWGEPS